MNGQHLYETVVRRFRAHRQRWMVLLLALSAALLLLTGIWLGQKAVYSGFGIEPARYRAQAVELEAARSELEALRRKLDIVETRHDVDRESLELVRRELTQYKEQIASLEEGVRFYRGLMSPGELDRGFSLRPIELVARESAGRYGYRIVARQEASEHPLLEGELRAEVVGLQDGEVRILPLAELSSEMDAGPAKLRFRYFQTLEGELQLPEGFEPSTVNIVAVIRSPRPAEVSESYPWQLQQYFTQGLR